MHAAGLRHDVTVTPFEHLRPAPSADHARWVVSTLTEPPGVGFRIPAGFDHIVRLHHPLDDGRNWTDVIATLPAPDDTRVGQVIDDLAAEHGNLDPAIVDRLVPLLRAASTTPEVCHYALWNGSGWLHAGAIKVVHWPAPRGARGDRSPWVGSGGAPSATSTSCSGPYARSWTAARCNRGGVAATCCCSTGRWMRWRRSVRPR